MGKTDVSIFSVKALDQGKHFFCPLQKQTGYLFKNPIQTKTNPLLRIDISIFRSGLFHLSITVPDRTSYFSETISLSLAVA